MEDKKGEWIQMCVNLDFCEDERSFKEVVHKGWEFISRQLKAQRQEMVKDLERRLQLKKENYERDKGSMYGDEISEDLARMQELRELISELKTNNGE